MTSMVKKRERTATHDSNVDNSVDIIFRKTLIVNKCIVGLPIIFLLKTVKKLFLKNFL